MVSPRETTPSESLEEVTCLKCTALQGHSTQSTLHPRKPRIAHPLRIAIFGFGTVGSSVARILVESKPQGLELTHVFNRGVARKRVDWTPASVVWSEDAEAVLASNVDVIVELAGGLDPAGTWVRRALEAGKSVVTANKKLIAYHGVDLERLAAAKGGHLKYGAAVAGGIPVIPGLEQGMAGDRIERIEGILNGTCNFILSKMDEGAEYAAVLARRRPKAMPKPTRQKMWADSTPAPSSPSSCASRCARRSIPRRSFPGPSLPSPLSTSVMPAIWADHSPGGARRKVEGQLAATVGPMLVALRSPLAWSQGTENMVIASGHYGGDVVFSRPRCGWPSHGRRRGQRPARFGPRFRTR